MTGSETTLRMPVDIRLLPPRTHYLGPIDWTKGKGEIHVSDLRTFLQCRRKWNWVSPLRHYLEPRAAYAPFIIGRAVHYALEHYYDTNKSVSPEEGALKWWNAELQEHPPTNMEAEEVMDHIKLTAGMLKHYHMWVSRRNHAGPFSDDNLDFISMETEFKVSISNGKRYSNKFYAAGRFDGIVRHKETGEHWIFESKTTQSVKGLANSLWNDLQASLYTIAAQKIFKVPVAGVLYNIMRKKIPTHASTLKSGLLSQNKSIDTSYDWYLNQIMEEDPRPDYVEPKTYAEAIRDHYGTYLNAMLTAEERMKWFARVPIRRTPFQLDQVEYNLYNIASQMVDPNVPTYPTPSWFECKRCLFKEPCMRKDRGQAYQWILDLEYQRRRQWDPMSGKEELE